MNCNIAIVVMSFLAFTCTSRQHILSEEPLIEYWMNFISASDIVALRRLSEKQGFEDIGEKTSATNGGKDFCHLNRTGTNDPDSDDWAAVSRFEAAAMKWAGLPLGISTPIITRWEPWVSRLGLDRTGLLHLDARSRPRNRRTVLAYLSGRDETRPINNGFTVFPCIETDNMDAKEAAKRSKICSRAYGTVLDAFGNLLKLQEQGLDLPPSKRPAFWKDHPELELLSERHEDGSFPIQWLWTADVDEPGALRGETLFGLAEAMCRGEADGLRIPATEGAALMFESATPGRKKLVPDWRLWHTGCSPGKSRSQRWTIQIFFDQPKKSRSDCGRKSCGAEL